MFDGIDTREEEEFRFLSISNSKPEREIRKPKFKIEYRVFTSKYHFPFRKGYKQHFTRKTFSILAISSRKPPTYKKRRIKTRLSVINFIKKVDQCHLRMESFTIEFFYCICTTISIQNSQLFYFNRSN